MLYVNSCISYCIKEDGIQKLYLKGIKYFKLQGRRTEIPLKVVNSQYFFEFSLFCIYQKHVYCNVTLLRQSVIEMSETNSEKQQQKST